ncbi:MAG: hypothetical protein PHU56_04315 [Candidatus Pacebacteria bacterium]|nr:hypothetical protein [Candidatus Paceibacterota bacterium]
MVPSKKTQFDTEKNKKAEINPETGEKTAAEVLRETKGNIEAKEKEISAENKNIIERAQEDPSLEPGEKSEIKKAVEAAQKDVRTITGEYEGEIVEINIDFGALKKEEKERRYAEKVLLDSLNQEITQNEAENEAGDLEAEPASKAKQETGEEMTNDEISAVIEQATGVLEENKADNLSVKPAEEIKEAIDEKKTGAMGETTPLPESKPEAAEEHPEQPEAKAAIGEPGVVEGPSIEAPVETARKDIQTAIAESKESIENFKKNLDTAEEELKELKNKILDSSTQKMPGEAENKAEAAVQEPDVTEKKEVAAVGEPKAETPLPESKPEAAEEHPEQPEAKPPVAPPLAENADEGRLAQAVENTQNKPRETAKKQAPAREPARSAAIDKIKSQIAEGKTNKSKTAGPKTPENTVAVPGNVATRIIELEKEISAAEAKGEVIKSAGLKKEKNYWQKKIEKEKLQKDLRTASGRKAKKIEKQISQLEIQEKIFEVSTDKNIKGNERAAKLRELNLAAEKGKTFKEKLAGLFTNREIGNRLLAGQVSALASALGLRTIYSLPTYLWQKSRINKLPEQLQNVLLASSKGQQKQERKIGKSKEPMSKREEMAKMMKSVKATKEGNQKGSVLRNTLAEQIRKGRAEQRELNKEENDKLKKILKKHAETKVNGLEAARDVLNSACVVSGLFYMRIFSKGLFDAANRYQRLKKSVGKGEKVSILKDVIAGGVAETFKKAAFIHGKDKSLKERGLEFASALGTLASYYGMGALSTRPENLNSDIDRLLETVRSTGQSGSKFFLQNAVMVAHRYGIDLSQHLEPELPAAKVPDLKPTEIIPEKRSTIFEEHPATPDAAHKMTAIPSFQRPAITEDRPAMHSNITEAQPSPPPSLVRPEHDFAQTEHLGGEPEPPIKHFDLEPQSAQAIEKMELPPAPAPAHEEISLPDIEPEFASQPPIDNDILETYNILSGRIEDDLTHGGDTLFLARLRNGQDIEFRHALDHNEVFYRLKGRGEQWQSVDDLFREAPTPYVPLKSHGGNESYRSMTESRHEPAQAPDEIAPQEELPADRIASNEQPLPSAGGLEKVLADDELRQRLNELPPSKDGKYTTFTAEQIDFRRNQDGQLEYSLDKGQSYAVVPPDELQLAPAGLNAENAAIQKEEAQTILEDQQRFDNGPIPSSPDQEIARDSQQEAIGRQPAETTRETVTQQQEQLNEQPPVAAQEAKISEIGLKDKNLDVPNEQEKPNLKNEEASEKASPEAIKQEEPIIPKPSAADKLPEVKISESLLPNDQGAFEGAFSDLTIKDISEGEMLKQAEENFPGLKEGNKVYDLYSRLFRGQESGQDSSTAQEFKEFLKKDGTGSLISERIAKTMRDSFNFEAVNIDKPGYLDDFLDKQARNFGKPDKVAFYRLLLDYQTLESLNDSLEAQEISLGK